MIILLFIIMPLDLSANEIFRDIAEQQAGRHGMGFQITDFNYNVSIIPIRTKLHLGDVCFDGHSVFQYLIITQLAIQLSVQFLYYRVQFDLMRME